MLISPCIRKYLQVGKRTSAKTTKRRNKNNINKRLKIESRPRGFSTFLNSVEHEILNAYKYMYINIKKFSLFLGSGKPRMLFFPLINVKMPTIGILTFMSRKNFVLS